MIYNRSWYNRAGVERVMKLFHIRASRRSSCGTRPQFERMLAESGIRVDQILARYHQGTNRRHRLEAREDDPIKAAENV